MTEPMPGTAPLRPALVLLMAITTGLAVGSNYFAQPLLQTIAHQFSLSYSDAGIIVTTAQIGYAAGLFLLLPLGDLFERRRLITVMMSLTTLGLVISAAAPNLAFLLAGTLLTGVFSVVAQVLVPFAATLAPPAARGKVVGTIMSGLLLGILLARTVAGVLSSLYGWQAVYALAATLMLANTIVLWHSLPIYRQSAGLSYGRLLLSVVILLRRFPLYRSRAALGFLAFAMFSVLWTPLAFLLSAPPWHYADATIGLFGLAGASGALAARKAGALVDQGHAHRTTHAAVVCLALSWVTLWWGGVSLIALIIGIVLLDLAVQAMHITNLNLIYSLDAGARNRLNSGYMTAYFLGGAFGSLAAAAAYQYFGWDGVVSLGGVLALLACLFGWQGRKLAYQSPH